MSVMAAVAFATWGLFEGVLKLSVPWSLRPRNPAAAATCGRGRCELPAILRLNPPNRYHFERPAKCKNPASSAPKWLRARLRPPWSLRFCPRDFCAAKFPSLGSDLKVILIDLFQPALCHTNRREACK